MSVVVAARTHHHGIVMACDSQVTDGYIKETTTQKIWTDGVVLYGACGDLRTIQVIRNFTPKASEDGRDLEESVLVNTLVQVLREAADRHGTLIRNDEGVDGFDAHLLVAYGNRVAMIDNTFAVMLPESGRAAIGTGREVALGYLHARGRGPWYVGDVTFAVEAAAELSVNVTPPVYAATTAELIVRPTRPFESQAFTTGETGLRSSMWSASGPS